MNTYYMVDGCLKAVDKSTKEIFTYHPILHDEEGRSKWRTN